MDRAPARRFTRDDPTHRQIRRTRRRARPRLRRGPGIRRAAGKGPAIGGANDTGEFRGAAHEHPADGDAQTVSVRSLVDALKFVKRGSKIARPCAGGCIAKRIFEGLAWRSDFHHGSSSRALGRAQAKAGADMHPQRPSPGSGLVRLVGYASLTRGRRGGSVVALGPQGLRYWSAAEDTDAVFH
jgi:hypothetical protein